MVTLAGVFAVGTLITLSATLPLAVLAAYGFRGTPFGRILRPLPVTVGAYALMNAAALVDLSSGAFYLACSLVGGAAALLSAVEAILVLTEWRPV